jgi:hypothetical protein
LPASERQGYQPRRSYQRPSSEEIKACDDAGITVTLPKPMTSGAKSEGRFGKQDFAYKPREDIYLCPAGERLTYRFTAEEHGQKLRRYWTAACHTCPIKARCTTEKERRSSRWEHEAVVEDVQTRLDKDPDAMRTRRETVEHPFGTMKMRMGATRFLYEALPTVAAEMALFVLTFNLTRELNMFGVERMMEAITSGERQSNLTVRISTSQGCSRTPSTGSHLIRLVAKIAP